MPKGLTLASAFADSERRSWGRKADVVSLSTTRFDSRGHVFEWRESMKSSETSR